MKVPLRIIFSCQHQMPACPWTMNRILTPYGRSYKMLSSLTFPCLHVGQAGPKHLIWCAGFHQICESYYICLLLTIPWLSHTAILRPLPCLSDPEPCTTASPRILLSSLDSPGSPPSEGALAS